MDFWLLDAKSTREVNGNMVAFDYINTYLSCEEAIKEAEFLSKEENVLDVSVHHWILREDGSQDHAEIGDETDIPYHFTNSNHWEIRGDR